MPDEPLLREKAREAIRSGKLPRRQPDRTFGSPGGGESCALCGEPVARDQMLIQIEYQRHATSGLRSYHLHLGCHEAWEFERAKVGNRQSG